MAYPGALFRFLRLVAGLTQPMYPSEFAVSDVSPAVDEGTSEQSGFGKPPTPFGQATVLVSDLNARTHFRKRASVRWIADMPVTQVSHSGMISFGYAPTM